MISGKTLMNEILHRLDNTVNSSRIKSIITGGNTFSASNAKQQHDPETLCQYDFPVSYYQGARSVASALMGHRGRQVCILNNKMFYGDGGICSSATFYANMNKTFLNPKARYGDNTIHVGFNQNTSEMATHVAIRSHPSIDEKIILKNLRHHNLPDKDRIIIMGDQDRLFVYRASKILAYIMVDMHKMCRQGATRKEAIRWGKNRMLYKLQESQRLSYSKAKKISKDMIILFSRQQDMHASGELGVPHRSRANPKRLTEEYRAAPPPGFFRALVEFAMTKFDISAKEAKVHANDVIELYWSDVFAIGRSSREVMHILAQEIIGRRWELRRILPIAARVMNIIPRDFNIPIQTTRDILQPSHGEQARIAELYASLCSLMKKNNPMMVVNNSSNPQCQSGDLTDETFKFLLSLRGEAVFKMRDYLTLVYDQGYSALWAALNRVKRNELAAKYARLVKKVKYRRDNHQEPKLTSKPANHNIANANNNKPPSLEAIQSLLKNKFTSTRFNATQNTSKAQALAEMEIFLQKYQPKDTSLAEAIEAAPLSAPQDADRLAAERWCQKNPLPIKGKPTNPGYKPCGDKPPE